MVVQQQQHFELTRAECACDEIRHCAGCVPTVAHLLEQTPCYRSREGSLAVGDTAQKLDNPLGRLGLEQVAGRAGTDRREQVLLVNRGRQHDDLGSRRNLSQQRERAETADTRHREIEQD